MLWYFESFRCFKWDNGWIEILFEELYNERMYFFIFMKMCELGWFMKMMIFGVQGVFFNVMFLSYLILL